MPYIKSKGFCRKCNRNTQHRFSLEVSCLECGLTSTQQEYQDGCKSTPVRVKVYAHYGETSFGLEVDKVDAIRILIAYLNKDTEVIEVEGYAIYPNELTQLEYFDLHEPK